MLRTSIVASIVLLFLSSPALLQAEDTQADPTKEAITKKWELFWQLDGQFAFQKPDDHTVVLTDHGKPVWQYNAAFLANKKVPESDPRHMAGCFVHPLYGLLGEELTDDAPKDHYHHHGVFWTWPHVAVTEPDGTVRPFDIWTGNTEMKQLFVKFGELKVEKDKAAFSVENGWFIAEKTNAFRFDEKGRPLDEKVMSESVTIVTHRVKNVNPASRAVDFQFVWTVGEKPITLRGAEEKSYGGLTVRFRPTGKQGVESLITVPDGVAEKDLPETPLPWADYTSQFLLDKDGKPVGLLTGAAVFVPKKHPDYPPTWLTRYYGPLCVGWPGVKDRTFRPGEKIELSYRIWIHDRRVSVAEITKAYEEYDAE